MPSFAQPFWLLAGLLVCGAAVLFLALRTRRRKQELAKFAAPHLLPLLTANVSRTRRRLKNVLFVLGLACLFLALARPQWGSSWIELRRKGIDLLIAVDVSKSMLAPDMKPSRLERAKLAVRDFTAKLDGGDRIGLLPFAGASFLRFPLTTDYDAFNTALSALSIETIPNPGTKIGPAIEEAVQLLSGVANHKILILLTDGEDLNEDEKGLRRALDLAAREKMLIYTVGVGTPQGELIPLPTGGFVQENGVFVTSRLDEQTLTAVAEATGGSYTPLGSMGEGLDSVYERKLALLPKNEQAPRKKRLPIERFQWPLAAAALLFSADFLLIGRRRRLRLPLIFTAGRRRSKTSTAALLLCFAAALPARADQGRDLYQAGKYGEAAAWYQQELAKDISNPVLHFNLGASLHQQGQHTEAAEAFTKALRSDDVELQGKSYFNRGLSLHHAGAKEEQAGALPQAVERLKQAEQSFAAAASLLPEAAKKEKAVRSQRIVKAKREQLEKRIQEQKQQKPDSGGNKEKKKQQEQPSGGEERQQKEQNQDGSGDKKPPSSGDGKEQQNKPDKKQQEGQLSAAPQSDADDKKTASQGGKEQPQAPSELGGAAPPPAGEQNSKDERIMGRMTQEEARILLDSLKGEQGELNFIPQEAADPTGGKDW